MDCNETLKEYLDLYQEVKKKDQFAAEYIGQMHLHMEIDTVTAVKMFKAVLAGEVF